MTAGALRPSEQAREGQRLERTRERLRQAPAGTRWPFRALRAFLGVAAERSAARPLDQFAARDHATIENRLG